MMQQIRLEKWVTTQDTNGNNDEQITSIISTWAEVDRSGGDRSSLNGQTGLTNFFIFRLRFNPKYDLTGNWKVVFDGREFTVHSIEKEKQQRFWLIIKAEAAGKK